jgi:hypothetical protein
MGGDQGAVGLAPHRKLFGRLRRRISIYISYNINFKTSWQ